STCGMRRVDAHMRGAAPMHSRSMRAGALSARNRSLFEQFRRLANLYFLCMSVLMLIGTYTTQFDSPLTPWSTLLPLIIVLAVTMAKEGAEDIKRHRSDALVNSRKCRRLRHDGTGALEEVIWKDIRVGDII